MDVGIANLLQMIVFDKMFAPQWLINSVSSQAMIYQVGEFFSNHQYTIAKAGALQSKRDNGKYSCWMSC